MRRAKSGLRATNSHRFRTELQKRTLQHEGGIRTRTSREGENKSGISRNSEKIRTPAVSPI